MEPPLQELLTLEDCKMVCMLRVMAYETEIALKGMNR